MRINTNITALNTYSQYTANNKKIGSAVAKLSSGYAINTAADNAAGLAISEKMRAQIRGLNKASANAQDAISLVQTAEGALDSSTEILQRMRELAVQSASDTNNDAIDREALQDEFAQLQEELDEIAKNATFNKKNLLDGSLAAKKTNITNVSLANSGMAISYGDVAAGSYRFLVSVKQESAAVSSTTGTTTASLGTTAKSLFTKATGTQPSYSGALYNGNYSLTTVVNDDNTLTVTANGDNGQTFTATISSAALDAVNGANYTTGDTLTLNFESVEGAADGFAATLELASAVSTSKNGLEALAAAINDVMISIDGGVDAKAATYGVYASLTGGESVKLQAGDTSVTFSNGITIEFDKLTATDAAVDLNATDITVPASSVTVPNGTTDTNSAFDVDLTAIVADYQSGDIKTYEVTIAGTTYSYTTTGLEANAAEVADIFGDRIDNTSVTLTPSNPAGQPPVAFTATNTNGVVTFATTTGTHHTGTGGIAGLAFDDVDVRATVSTAALSKGLLTKVGSADNIASTAPVMQTDDTEFTVVQTANAGLTFQVGANQGDEMTINIEKMDCQTLGINSAKIVTQESASAAIKSVDTAINKVSSQRAALGAIQNRLEYKINNLNTSAENLTSAESQIRDVDMAKEMTNFTNANILQQAATAMLAQANALPQNVLSLIGG